MPDTRDWKQRLRESRSRGGGISPRLPLGHARTARVAIRERCMQCVQSAKEIERCTAKPGEPPPGGGCPLWVHRLVHRERGHREGTLLKAIRAYCLWCAGGSQAVAECPSSPCALWPFRFGIRPATAERRGHLAITGAERRFNAW